MASRFYQQSLRRKLIYFLLIAVIYTGILLVRKDVESRADALELREQNLGEVELTDKAMRLTLTGSRGFAVCGLWWAAIEKQKKQEWNELELLVRSVIKLQPHFDTPWIFQSWNLAYNVAVECDRIKDKYFYIARGTQLLAEGDRMNKNNPAMRLHVGMYTQNQLGISDKHNTLRCLYQLSCIDPVERDPSRFRRWVNERNVIDMDQFKEFCERHPFLIRRLRDKLGYHRVDEIIDFLADSQRIPSRYEERSERVSDSDQAPSRLKLNAEERYPILPPEQRFAAGELTNDSDLGDDFDNYAAARAWYSYAQDPLEAHMRITSLKMAPILFMSKPPRAQAYVGERLEEEGWFDKDGWDIQDWFAKDKARPGAGKEVLHVGRDRNWAAEAWGRAYQMWKDFGESKGVLRTPEQLESMSEDELKDYYYQRDLSNFARHFAKADVERQPETVAARKHFFLADQQRRRGDFEQAMETYLDAKAFPTWKKILEENSEFRQDEDVQEETYLMQRKFLKLIHEKRLKALKNLLFVQDCLTWGAVRSPAEPLGVPLHLFPAVRMNFKGPFDVVDQSGRPLLSERAVATVLDRYHLPAEIGQAQPKEDLGKLKFAPIPKMTIGGGP